MAWSMINRWKNVSFPKRLFGTLDYPRVRNRRTPLQIIFWFYIFFKIDKHSGMFIPDSRLCGKHSVNSSQVHFMRPKWLWMATVSHFLLVVLCNKAIKQKIFVPPSSLCPLLQSIECYSNTGRPVFLGFLESKGWI